MPSNARLLPSAFAVIASCIVAAPVAAAERMASTQVADLTLNDRFEFRGFTRTLVGFEDHIWHFTPDGKVRSESAMHRGNASGMGVQFGIRFAGTWTRDGDAICVAWEASARRFDGCYGLLTGRAHMVHFVGPQFIEGTLAPAAAPGAPRMAER